LITVDGRDTRGGIVVDGLNPSISFGLAPQCTSTSRIFNPLACPPSHTLWCYGCKSESFPSPKCQVPSSRYRKSKCGEDIPLTKGMRHYRESRDRDVQARVRSMGNSRAGTFSFLMALLISSSSRLSSTQQQRLGMPLSSVTGRLIVRILLVAWPARH